MATRTSKGRYGGGGGKTDKGEAVNDRAQARLNTDVDSLARDLNNDRARGHRSTRHP